MKFNKGDKVTIIKPKSVDGPYFNAQIYWMDEMDRFVGRELTITEVHDHSYICDIDIRWSWLEEWIEDPMISLINMVTK